jgi:hypothetical protein
MKATCVLLLVALGLAGCSVGVSYDPSASADTSWDARRCELWGGYWNRTANVCEAPFPH